MELTDILADARMSVRPGRKRSRYTSVISTRRASKPKALLGARLVKDEWLWLGCHSSSGWMAEWSEQLTYQEEVRKFEESIRSESGSELSQLLKEARLAIKRGRPRKRQPELVQDPEVQTGYGLKLLELQEKYPVSKYYWNDGPGDPREIPWGSAEDIAKLVDKVL